MQPIAPADCVVSQFNTGRISAITCFDRRRVADKKSQIPVQQNLASEEGDEKQYDNDPKLQAAIFPLYL